METVLSGLRSMHWYNYVLMFFGGAVFANSLPHLVNGVSGRPFQSPFADPPGKGLSSPVVNVLWGMLNLSIAYVLIVIFSRFNFHSVAQSVAVGAGFLMMSLLSARLFGRFHDDR